MSDLLDALIFREGILIGILSWIVVALIILLVLILTSLAIQGCKAVYVKINTAEIVEEDIFVTVVEKDYNESYTTFVKVGSVTTPIHHGASYGVYLKYDDEKVVIDDQKLYNRVNKNDKLRAKLIKYLSKDGKVLETDIKVEKDS